MAESGGLGQRPKPGVPSFVKEEVLFFVFAACLCCLILLALSLLVVICEALVAFEGSGAFCGAKPFFFWATR